MGDGNVNSSGGNPRLRANMISRSYLQYIDDKFGILSNGVKMSRSSKESAKLHRVCGFNSNADESDYSNVYTWRSMRHPELKEFSNWYSSGEKIWPNEIDLTPTVLKHWYCCDGTWNNKNHHNYISISSFNERCEIDKIEEMFERSGLPEPNNYSREKDRLI